ncbi:MAG: redoxin domain-containing protein [Saprospiraceae bacterium]|nr:redoxin domain-containing protein [Saprospiraceae bacterium]
MKNLLIIIAVLIAGNTLSAQSRSSQRIPLIGSQAPAFKSSSTNGPIAFPADFSGKWKILFAHPRDFTPVCSSEILDLGYRQDEFAKLNTQIVVLSVDRMVSHQSWKADLEEIDFKGRGKVKIGFPLVVDSTYAIAYKYGMVDTENNPKQSVRGIFFIDPENKIRAFQFYPSEVGRNTDEILRTLTALQVHDQNKDMLLPANWRPGDDYMKAFLTPVDKEELKRPDSDLYYINWYMIFKKAI